MHRTILSGGWLATALLSIISLTAEAQLAPATWGESIILSYKSTTTNQWYGANAALPEAHSEELKATAYDIKGSLSYGPPGPPQIISHAEGFGPYITGRTSGTLSFSFQVVQTSTPPVPVSSVPITIAAFGSAEAAGGCSNNPYECSIARATVYFSVDQAGTQVMDETLGSIGALQSLNASKVVSAVIGEPLNALMTAVTYVMESPLMPTSHLRATASVYPTVTVRYDVIPGTDDSRYSDYFHIEYSPGYWALGNPTPVQTSTWGKIKSQYLQR